MLRRFFGRGPSKGRPLAPAGNRAYAIGDIHGRLDLLTELLGRIQKDNADRSPAKTWLILLGDLVDRGPDSRGVIEYFVSMPPAWARTVTLKGNHEELFLSILAGNVDLVPEWLAYGGYECAESYGVSKLWTLNTTPAAIGKRLADQVPESHRAFLEGMADTFRFGDYLFVHAGIRPGVPIEEQTGKDLRWIRTGFLDDGTDHGLVVVHGHTIVPAAEQHANRIALDTGAYRTGVLTAIGLEGPDRWFIEAREKVGAPC